MTSDAALIVAGNGLPRAGESCHAAGTSSALDGDLEAIGLVLDEFGLAAVELTDPDDPAVVTDVAVVQDQVLRRGVVAKVGDLRVGAVWHAVGGEGRGSLAIFSSWFRSRKLRVIGS